MALGRERCGEGGVGGDSLVRAWMGQEGKRGCGVCVGAGRVASEALLPFFMYHTQDPSPHCHQMPV